MLYRPGSPRLQSGRALGAIQRPISVASLYMLMCATNQIGDAEPQKQDESWNSFLCVEDCCIIVVAEIQNTPLGSGQNEEMRSWTTIECDAVAEVDIKSGRRLAYCRDMCGSLRVDFRGVDGPRRYLGWRRIKARDQGVSQLPHSKIFSDG